MSAAVLLTTAPDVRTARKIAETLVARRLAACVNVLYKARSFYRWKGRVEQSGESLLVIKTVKRNFRRIQKVLDAAHPYDLPELVALPVVWGSKGYLTWLEKSVKKKFFGRSFPS